MAIQNEKFSLLVSNSSGNPLTGALVELRKDATIYTCSEVGNGWYSIASIPTGKYSVFVDSVDTGETKAVGSGQVAALGNTADNVPVSNATEYDFQDPTTLKTTLSLNNVANVAVPSPTGSDANKVIQVDSNGDYVLSSIAASGFESVYEVLTTSDLSAALSAEYDSKLLVITREDFNFTNAQTFEVWGSCSIIVANTSEPFQWSSNAVNATFNLKSGADSSLTGMFFLNGVIAFGDNSDYTLNIPWKVTNLDFISPEVSRSVDGTSTLTYELLKASIPVSVTVTTVQDWWQNSAGDKLDTVVAGTNITIDNTDPQNPIINSTASGGTPGGSDTQVQFNDGGAFGGDAGLTYNKTTDVLTVGGVNAIQDLDSVLTQGNTSTQDATLGGLELGTLSNLSKFDNTFTVLNSDYGSMVTKSGSAELGFLQNAYYDGTNWRSFIAAECQRVLITPLGDFLLFSATATASDQIITWTQKFEVDKDGIVTALSAMQAPSIIADTDMEVGTDNSASKWDGTTFIPYVSGRGAFTGKSGSNEASLYSNVYYNGGWKSFAAGECLRVLMTGLGDFKIFGATATTADEALTLTEIISINRDGSVDVSDKLNLAPTTNASPTNGDIWYDGTNVNIQGIVNLRSQSLLGASYVDIKDSTGWGVRVDGTNDALRPLADNDTELGLSIRRWSKVWATDADFSGSVNIGDVLNLVPRASDPSTPSDGDIWYNSTSGTFKCRANGVTETIAFV